MRIYEQMAILLTSYSWPIPHPSQSYEKDENQSLAPFIVSGFQVPDQKGFIFFMILHIFFFFIIIFILC
jgi:hypothetical protein